MRMRVRSPISLLIGAVVAVAVPLGASLFNSRHVEAFTLQPCHDDSSISRSNTHGSPLNGTFIPHGGYYYLDISTSGCSMGSDGLTHLVGHVQANGIGLLAGHPSCSGAWGPPCDPSWRAETDSTVPSLASDNPTWGFELWDASHTTMFACTGTYNGTNSNCPGTANITATPGDTWVEFRYNGKTSNTGFRWRIANAYDSVIWEESDFDTVTCNTCEPSWFTGSSSTTSSTTSVTTRSTPTATTTTSSSTTSSSSSTSTATSSSTTSSSSATTQSPPSGTCAGLTLPGTVSGSSQSFFLTATAPSLCATLTWSGSAGLDLVLYADGSGTAVLVQNTSGVSGESIQAPVVVGQVYKLKVHPESSTAATFSCVVGGART